MTKVEKIQNELPGLIADYCKAKEISNNDFAKQVNISPALLSNMLSGKWENITDAKWLKVYNFVNDKSQVTLIVTRDFKAGHTLLGKALNNQMMVGLIGDTGMGKTTLLKAYLRKKNVYYFYIDTTITPKIFLKDLLRKLGAAFEGSLNEMLSRAVDLLNAQLDPLIIIDESAKLKDNMMLILHSLRDQTANNCGMALAGMPDFKNKLIRRSDRQTTGYSEFFRRIEIWHELQGLTPNEVIKVLEDNGITDEDAQRDMRNIKRFGDLVNEIRLYKELND